MNPIRFGLAFQKAADGKTYEDGPDGKGIFVSAIATAELLDKQNEILTYAGSKAALAKWSGEVTDLHGGPLSGKSVAVTFDEDAKSILVKSFIGADAPKTIERVKKGELLGYSVEGDRVDGKTRVEKRDGKDVRITDEWIMSKLALVPDPALPTSALTICKGSNVVPASELDAGPIAKHWDWGSESDDLSTAARIVSDMDCLMRAEVAEVAEGSAPVPVQMQLLKEAKAKFLEFLGSEAQEALEKLRSEVGKSESHKPIGLLAVFRAQAALLKAIEALKIPEAPAPLDVPALTKSISEPLSKSVADLTAKVTEMQKANGHLKGLPAEVKAIREGVEIIKSQPVPGGPRRNAAALIKTAEVPNNALIGQLEEMVATESNPELKSRLQQKLNLARIQAAGQTG